jgi:hypothetical protein
MLVNHLRKNYSSATLWILRQKAAMSGTGVIQISIEDLNRIDKECAIDYRDTCQCGQPAENHFCGDCLESYSHM